MFHSTYLHKDLRPRQPGIKNGFGTLEIPPCVYVLGTKLNKARLAHAWPPKPPCYPQCVHCVHETPSQTVHGQRPENGTTAARTADAGTEGSKHDPRALQGPPWARREGKQGAAAVESGTGMHID